MLSHVLAGDDTGMLALSWFNAPYAAEKLEPGTEYYFEGRVGGMMTRREILHPLVRHRSPGCCGAPAAGLRKHPKGCRPPA